MKKKFITGLVAILPIGLTIFVIWFLVMKIGGILETVFKKIPFLSLLPSPVVSLIGLLALIIVIYIIGFITSSYIGNRILKFTDFLITRLPVIRTLYLSARKITNAIFVDKSAFKKAVFVEYPRKGIYTIGFMTNEESWETDDKEENVNIFIPTTPNPTSGIYVVVPKKDIRDTYLSIDEALQTIISGGVILPKKRKLTKLGGNKDEKRKEE
jgi:uncharacterized membrane protein